MKVSWHVLAVLAVVGVAAMAQPVVIPREEIVWTGGYWTLPGNWNPLGWSTAWGTFFMYEPLFAWVHDKVVGILGESIKWIDPWTIEIKIRDEARWSDGKPVTAEDVIHTFDYLYPRHWKNLGYDARRERSEAVGDKIVRVYLKREFPYSRVVWGALTGGTLVLPKHVWTEIEAEYGFPYEWVYNNDWRQIKPEWRVASGMYFPTAATPEYEILVRNEEWWGKAVWGLPAPKYIGHRYFATNYAANVAFERGDLDWSGFYYPRIWEIANKPAGPFVNTWTMRKPPYFAHSSVVEIVFNHNIYPLNEPWLHHAIAQALNYRDISIVSVSGYVEQALVTRISPQSAEGAKLTDWDIVKRYQPSYDPEKAIAILQEHCFRHADGFWYTKDAPEVWRGQPVSDMLPDVPGRNVRLGPWTMIVPYGWTDSMMQTVLFQRDIGEIGIRVEPVFLEFGTYTAKFMAMDFQLMHFCMGGGGYDATFHGNYSWVYTGTPGQWTNFSGWHHPDFPGEPPSAQEFVTLLDQLDITAEGTPEEKELVRRLQEILAKEMPTIPVFYNAYWYSFSQMYWHNWPTVENPYLQPLAPWATGNPGAMQILLRSLRKGAQRIPADKYPWIPAF